MEDLPKNLAKEIERILGLKNPKLNITFPPDDKLGDFALSCFELAKAVNMNPVACAEKIAKEFKSSGLISSLSNTGPYLNFRIDQGKFLQNTLADILKNKNFGKNDSGNGQKILLEFSGPNTNKPQHIGHLRNNIIGQSLVNLYRSCGYKVIATNIINDRGIHIIKSMLAWQEFANSETPKSSGIKGDHLVGKYYVKFGEVLKAEEKEYLAKNKINPNELNDLEKRKFEYDFLKQSTWMRKAREMLIKWENNDPDTRKLWKMMNDWVYDGYKVTYNDLGIIFDHVDYESDNYLLGKDLIELGLKNKIFYKKEDGSVWIDLRNEGLDEKIVLRSDGTSVYITQDMGTAKLRYDKFKFNKAIYVVASEQDYHFKVLFLILKKLGFAWAENLFHLSYGMVSRPEGKIKSREGKTADADTIISETMARAKEMMSKAEKQIEHHSDKNNITKNVALAAIKFFMLGTNPQKNIVYDPASSISLDGYTGPFIQYTHARLSQILAKNDKVKKIDWSSININDEEKKLAKFLLNYPETIKQAAAEYNPAVLTHYLFDLAKIFNNFYQQHSVLSAENENTKNMRIQLCLATQKVIANALDVLGIKALKQM